MQGDGPQLRLSAIDLLDQTRIDLQPYNGPGRSLMKISPDTKREDEVVKVRLSWSLPAI